MSAFQGLCSPLGVARYLEAPTRNQAVSSNVIYLATIWVLPVIIAITFHEAAHGFVAHLLGDDTAWRLGRVSFNPAKHIDPFGTLLGVKRTLPIVLRLRQRAPSQFSCLVHLSHAIAALNHLKAGPGTRIVVFLIGLLMLELEDLTKGPGLLLVSTDNTHGVSCVLL